jgi:hypothetical protein
MIPCLLYQARTIGILVHNSVFIVHFFRVLVHFCGSFPRLKVTFDHGTLLHFETSDTRGGGGTYFDGDKITTTEAAETSLCLLKWKKFVVRIIHYFANLIARRSEKSDSLFTWHNVCCNWSWTAVFVFHAGFLGWVNNLENWEMYVGYLVTKAGSILLWAENAASRVVFSLSLAKFPSVHTAITRRKSTRLRHKFLYLLKLCRRNAVK